MSHSCFKFLLLLKHVFLSSKVFFVIEWCFLELNSFNSFKKKCQQIVGTLWLLLNYNSHMLRVFFKLFKMFWLSFGHYQLTNHFGCKANIWGSLLNIMNLGTKKNLHIDTLWEVEGHSCYVGRACFLTIYWQFQTVSFWKYFNKAAFRFTDQQEEYTDQRVHCMNDIHPSMFLYFLRVVFLIFVWGGGGGEGYGWFWA
jgi:hypothetical protein